MDNQDGRLWLPGGSTTTQERQVAQAVGEYDRDLKLGQRSDGEWVVFLCPEGEQNPFPVLGLGFQLPSSDLVKEKLFKHDTRRNGRKIYSQMLRRMEDGKKASIARGDEGAGEAAEAMASAFRRQGAHPSPRIFVPRTW